MARTKSKRASDARPQTRPSHVTKEFSVACRVSGDDIALEGNPASLSGYIGDIFDILLSLNVEILKLKCTGVITVLGSATLAAEVAESHLPGEIADEMLSQIRLAVPQIIQPALSSKMLVLGGDSADFYIELTLSFEPDPQVTDDINEISNYKLDLTEGKQGQGGPEPLADEEYVRLARQLQERSHAFRQQLAAELTPALNARIRGEDMPHDTLDGKKNLARWVNDEVERFGLAVQCPNTGRPAKLRGVTGSWLDVGRFCFETHIDGKREKSAYSDTLPELTLTDATPPKEPEKDWQQTVRPKASRPGRRR